MVSPESSAVPTTPLPSAETRPATTDSRRGDRAMLVSCAVLLVALGVLGVEFELGTQAVVFRGEMPLLADTGARSSDDGGAHVMMSPLFSVEHTTTLRVHMVRPAVAGFVGADVALIRQHDQEVREVSLATRFEARSRARAEGGSLEDSAVIDRVEPGDYVLRFAPRAVLEVAPEPGAAPPMATVRVQRGARSPMAFWIAAVLLTLPPIAIVSLRVVARRRSSGV